MNIQREKIGIGGGETKFILQNTLIFSNILPVELLSFELLYFHIYLKKNDYFDDIYTCIFLTCHR